MGDKLSSSPTRVLRSTVFVLIIYCHLPTMPSRDDTAVITTILLDATWSEARLAV